MIITLNIQSENIYFKIFETVNIAFNKLGINTRKDRLNIQINKLLHV